MYLWRERYAYTVSTPLLPSILITIIPLNYYNNNQNSESNLPDTQASSATVCNHVAAAASAMRVRACAQSQRHLCARSHTPTRAHTRTHLIHPKPFSSESDGMTNLAPSTRALEPAASSPAASFSKSSGAARRTKRMDLGESSTARKRPDGDTWRGAVLHQWSLSPVARPLLGPATDRHSRGRTQAQGRRRAPNRRANVAIPQARLVLHRQHMFAANLRSRHFRDRTAVGGSRGPHQQRAVGRAARDEAQLNRGGLRVAGS
jgi:hypothetical protein